MSRALLLLLAISRLHAFHPTYYHSVLPSFRLTRPTLVKPLLKVPSSSSLWQRKFWQHPGMSLALQKFTNNGKSSTSITASNEEEEGSAFSDDASPPPDDDASSSSSFDGKGLAGYLAPYAVAVLASIAVTGLFVKFVLLDY